MSTIVTRAILDALAGAGELVSARHVPDSFTDVTDDSRRATPGALFVAVRGGTHDGHAFVGDASAAGATAAIVAAGVDCPIPAIVVRDTRRAAGITARAAFGAATDRLTIVGVTGTNGKTTTVSILRHLLDRPDAAAASIGTLGVLRGSVGAPEPGGSGLTTPGVVELHRLLGRLAGDGVRTVAMEVSSHSLDQGRVDGVRFDTAVFTNVSRDHLDYHGTMEAYVAAKARLLEHLDGAGTAIVNADEPAWDALRAGHRRVRFSVSQPVEVMAQSVRWLPGGSEFVLTAGASRAGVRFPLPGGFNVANALAAAAAAWSLGLPVERIADRLSSTPQVPGRLERVLERPLVLRDYAHTPDALERALDAVRPAVPPDGRLIVVFGCGGDRDRGKRPQMGAIAESKADYVIITSDNPRTEDPERILDEIESGMRLTAKHERIEDRRGAIARALAIASPADLVVLAGKGHETYQIRGTTSHPFDEKRIVRELAREPVERA